MIHQGLYMVQSIFLMLFYLLVGLVCWWISIYIGIVFIFFIQLEKGSIDMLGCLIGLLLCSYARLFIYPYLDSQAQLIVLDVGQGEAILIELPYRKEVILIDLGGIDSFSQRSGQFPNKNLK